MGVIDGISQFGFSERAKLAIDAAFSARSAAHQHDARVPDCNHFV
jgi:hypothetical protein